MTAEQLAFSLPMRVARGRDDFFVSPANADALAIVEGWRKWPSGKLILTGPAKSGKTHLTHVWAELTDATVVGAADLDDRTVPALAEAPAVAIEDADRTLVSETALFHLHNLMQESGAPLLISARTPPRDWALDLPDLQSRMTATSIAPLSPPDDDLLRAVVLKQFADRQLAVSPELIDWLLSRIDRSFAAAKRAVEVLDAAALAGKRPVTRALAREFLDKITDADA